MSETRTVWNPFSHRYVEVPFPASSPRPAAPDTTGGELREESVDLTPGVVWTDAQLAVVRDLAARTHRAETALRAAHVAAPDTTGGELREAIAGAIYDERNHCHLIRMDWSARFLASYLAEADAVLALPALRDLLAERDTLAAQVRAVEGLVAFLDEAAEIHDMHGLVTAHRPIAKRLRRALGTPTTGAGQ